VSALDGNDPLVSLSDDRVTLRPWYRDDAQFMAIASADPEIRRYNGVHDRQGNPAPALSIEEAERAIDRFRTDQQEFEETGNPTGVVFAIADATSGELVGCSGVDDWTEEDVAQFGYWVAAPARGHGYATLAAILLTRWLFERGAARVFLTVVVENHDSAAVARRAGFEHEGTMRDYGIWQGQRCDVMVFAAVAIEWSQ
jgi:RimJ/RimL family protein N-acetyltransferase